MGIYVSQFSRLIEEVTGDNFDVEFDIIYVLSISYRWGYM